jgi:hypothetical protein
MIRYTLGAVALRREIWLHEEDASAAAVGLRLPFMLHAAALEPGAFATQPICGPKATLMDYLFHPLEPPWVKGMVIWEIK